MAKVKMNQEGVAALRSLATALPEAVELTTTATENMKSAFDEKKSVLGPHTAQIEQIIEQVKMAQVTGSKSTAAVQVSLIKAAAALQAILSRNISISGGNP